MKVPINGDFFRQNVRSKMVSVLTNPGAMTALRTFGAAGAKISAATHRVSTGLKVADPYDSASNFAIAQGLRSEARAWNVVAKGLRASAGVVDVALAGSTAISNMLIALKAKVIEYDSADTSGKAIIQNDVEQMLAQIDQLADNATFNGSNLINSDQASVAVTAR
jgi:flagellin